MKNVPLGADDNLIEAARRRARAERETLNTEFRRQFERRSRSEDRVRACESLMDDLRRRVKTGGREFTRDEMNER